MGDIFPYSIHYSKKFIFIKKSIQGRLCKYSANSNISLELKLSSELDTSKPIIVLIDSDCGKDTRCAYVRGDFIREVSDKVKKVYRDIGGVRYIDSEPAKINYILKQFQPFLIHLMTQHTEFKVLEDMLPEEIFAVS